MKFPKTEAEAVALIKKMIAGLPENPDFPSPPVSSTGLSNRLDAFTAASAAQTAIHASGEQATEAKRVAYEEMLADMKFVISYAEHAVDGNDAKLSTLGWGGRSPATPLVAPGQPLNLRVVQQGQGTLSLGWNRPNEGGTAAYYVIKRRVRDSEADWEPVGTIMFLEIELVNQERSKELDYCVVAINKAGESLPSNSVTVIL
jgi:hypothetical protein